MRIIDNKVLIEVDDTVEYEGDDCIVKYIGKNIVVIEDFQGNESAIDEGSLYEIVVPVILRNPEETTVE